MEKYSALQEYLYPLKFLSLRLFYFNHQIKANNIKAEGKHIHSFQLLITKRNLRSLMCFCIWLLPSPKLNPDTNEDQGTHKSSSGWTDGYKEFPNL